MDVLIGSAVGCLPLINELYKAGRSVRLIGHSESQTGAWISDDFVEIAYKDRNSYFQSIDSIDRQFDGMNIYPGPHDLCYRIYVEYMVYKGKLHEKDAFLAEQLHNKMLFRQILQSISTNHSPKVYDIDRLSSGVDNIFPILFKPVHAGGGRGIVKLSNHQELISHKNNRAGFDGNGIYEELAPGDLYSISLWYDKDKVEAYYSEKEFIDLNEFRVNASITSNSIQTYIGNLKIPETLAKILYEFGLKKGYCHTQVLIDSIGNWKIVECTLRFPGDIYCLNAENFGAFPYSRMYLNTYQQKGRVLFDFPSKAVFPSESIYGRVMHKDNQKLSEKIKPFFSYKSHNNDLAYNISYFKMDIDAFTRNFNVFEHIED